MQRFLRRMAVLGPARFESIPSAQARTLPAPLDPACYSNGQQLEPTAAHIESGWEFVPVWAPPMKELIRPGFVNCPMLVASAPGAELVLEFDGRAVGIQVVAGHDAGALTYSIDGGPEATVELFTPWSANLHLPWFHVLAAGLEAGPHKLVLRSKTGKAGGQVARIQTFLVDRGERQ